MSRGKYAQQKGRKRRFTTPEELQQQAMKESDLSDEWWRKCGRKADRDTNDDDDSQQEQQQRGSDDDSDMEPTDDSEAEARDAKKGVASLIAIKNPNRVRRKIIQKLARIRIDDDDDATSGSGDDARAERGGNFKAHKPEMCREKIELKKSLERYEKRHLAENTIKAKSDLARLKLIRQQREEAAAKREALKRAAAERVPKKLFIRKVEKNTETRID